MSTKTFSSRADERRLAYADAVVRERFGMSFGQYCGSILVDAVCEGVELPDVHRAEKLDRRAKAIARMKALSTYSHDEAIGRLSDEEIKKLIAGRYE